MYLSRSSRFALYLFAALFCAGALPGHAKVKPLSQEEASYGSINLRYDYPKAVKERSLAKLFNLYESLQGKDPSAVAAIPWVMPEAQEENGIRVYRYENRVLSAEEIPGFLHHYMDAFDEMTRAQIWFSRFKRINDKQLDVLVWVEMSGRKGSAYLSQRGKWRWQLVRADAKAPWTIRQHTLVDFDEIYRAAPLFNEVAKARGIDMVNRMGAHDEITIFIPEVHAGSGAAAADFDGDGWVDVYIADGEHNRLFRNKGNGAFEDVTEKSGTAFGNITRGVLFEDLTGDGKPDIFLANAYVPNVLYRNNGNGTFTDISAEAGIGGSGKVATSAAAVDVDNDGDLDLLVTYYRDPNIFWPRRVNANDGERNLLFINDGHGHFTEEGIKRGLTDTRWTLAASFADYDNDGDQDLYVANDFGVANFYINQGNGYFVESSKKVGLGARGFSMSATWGDYNNDGLLDLYVSKMTSGTAWMFPDKRFPMQGIQRLFRKPTVDALLTMTSGNSLYKNLGNGKFEDVTEETRSEVAHWAWGSTFIDYDNDGDQDIYCCNGFWSGESKEDT